jgi:hypothetical protein
VYFSEELKAIVKYGYKVELIEGYACTKEYLFKGYVDHFYEQKKVSTGAERFIAKMHLNQLYGIFGRKQYLIQTININKKMLPAYLTGYVIKGIIEISDDVCALLIKSNIDTNILDELNLDMGVELKSTQLAVQSNVAIAAAVTAYARIHMMPFKLDDGICYTDTDSIFTTNKLSDALVGPNLGLMKDELNGKVIKEACFLDIKKYGYYYLDENGQRVESSVFAGVERDSLSFDQVENIFKGGTITKEIPVRFYKSFKDLNIRIHPTSVTISNCPNKKLVDNTYIPTNINMGFHDINLKGSFKKIVMKHINNYVKKYFPDIYDASKKYRI